MFSGKVNVFRQSDCIREKVVVFGRVFVIGQKMVVCRQRCCLPAKMVVFGEK